ncbi:pyridoxal-phosphate dependent enzyme [Micromonospora sp. WMMD882]|uniref:pyridoxal-phosphate dependent enzyme n=1 Tax=Micromonospora sp. WMMD882 TaxID=3015151 RepID=UPI00248CE45F|nr:pyridoxal-phosphate dependent enzyme [Micromonospora sp. WMMD882]WBB81232.1 pyridoxal-phosphate dependent enzyme [Micromonospora sp. WMMD882]
MPPTGTSATTPLLHSHATDAIKAPSFIRLSENLVLARFETLKVYAALGAVRALLKAGTVRPGDTLVDSSSGIYALALAMVCHRYGLRCHIVASTTVTAAIRAQLEILGATVDQMPPAPDLRLDQHRRVARVQELLRRNPGMHWMRQYHDPTHRLGYAELAALVRAVLPQVPLTVVASVGTGASSAGLVQPLRADDPATRLVGVQPFGSVSFGSERFPDPEAIIAGIGSAIPFDNVRHELYDQVHWVTFRHAAAGTVALMRAHAVFAGLSTGAAYLAGRWEARRHPERTHLLVGADTGHRYVEKVFTRHRDVPDADTLEPVEIATLDELAPPWSTMPWARRDHPPARPPAAVAPAVTVPPAVAPAAVVPVAGSPQPPVASGPADPAA